MLLLSPRLSGVPLMSIQTGTRLAVTTEPIIDPRKLYIVAFYCDGRTLDITPAVIHTSDIREVSDIGFIIDSSDSIMAPGELVRLREIIDFHFQLLGIAVIDSHGHKLGSVNDYTVDTTSFMVQKLHVKPPLLRSFSSSELIVDRSQIVEVNSKHIVVRAPTVEQRETQSAQQLQPFSNPFRKAAETIKR